MMCCSSGTIVNYAVLANILQQNAAQGNNNTLSNLAGTCAQAMMAQSTAVSSNRNNQGGPSSNFITDNSSTMNSMIAGSTPITNQQQQLNQVSTFQEQQQQKQNLQAYISRVSSLTNGSSLSGGKSDAGSASNGAVPASAPIVNAPGPALLNNTGGGLTSASTVIRLANLQQQQSNLHSLTGGGIQGLDPNSLMAGGQQGNLSSLVAGGQQGNLSSLMVAGQQSNLSSIVAGGQQGGGGALASTVSLVGESAINQAPQLNAQQSFNGSLAPIALPNLNQSSIQQSTLNENGFSSTTSRAAINLASFNDRGFVTDGASSSANSVGASRISDESTLPSHVLQAQQNDPSRRSMPLWAPEDEKRLSTQQCWLRKQIETFPATTRDVRTRGRNRLLDIGQIGIQCIHCKNVPQEGRGKGSSYFPASIKSVYQSAQNMLTFHFKEDTCPLVPRHVLQQMREAGETSSICPRMAPKAGKSRTGGGKAYWESSAASITGLVDTTVGIRYGNDVQNYLPLDSIAQKDPTTIATILQQ